MEKTIKLRSRRNDFGYKVVESEAYNVLNMVPKGKEPFVDSLLCSVEGMWETVFPFTLATPYSYRISDDFVDPSGGPMIHKGQTLTSSDFFKHKVSTPLKTQEVGCKKCDDDDEYISESSYVEKDKIVVDIVSSGAMTVILLKDVEM